LGVEFFGSKQLIKNDNTTEQGINAGQDTIRFITKNGKKSLGEGGFNFLHSEVRSEMLMLAKDISERYSQYPSIKGVMWMRSPEFVPAKNDKKAKTGIDIGYDDLSIQLFEEETGINVPEYEINATRFKKRFLWLMQNQRQNWLNWRANKSYGLLSEIKTILSRKRRDWYLWHTATWPTPHIM